MLTPKQQKSNRFSPAALWKKRCHIQDVQGQK